LFRNYALLVAAAHAGRATLTLSNQEDELMNRTLTDLFTDAAKIKTGHYG